MVVSTCSDPRACTFFEECRGYSQRQAQLRVLAGSEPSAHGIRASSRVVERHRHAVFRSPCCDELRAVSAEFERIFHGRSTTAVAMHRFHWMLFFFFAAGIILAWLGGRKRIY